MISTSILQANTIHVPGDEPTIQAGIDTCVDGDTVLVADGTYTGDGNRDIDFGGRAIVVMSENGPEVSIIDCEDAGRGFYFHSGEDATSVLQGFTITNGYASINNPGGGIYNWRSSPTVTNCTFSGNTAYDMGGGMANFDYSNPTVTNCTFSDNSTGYGGGMFNSDSHPTVSNCTFIGNWTVFNGGGMNNDSYSSPTVTNCTFIDNSALSNGGGMSNDYGNNPAVINCTFSDNSAGDGGGMYNDSYSRPTVTNCTFRGNSATSGFGSGGGMYNNNSSSPTVTNCTFSDNSAEYEGGGMYNDYSSPTVTNCTLSGNSTRWSGSGGGMYNDYSSPTVTNCTFSGNTANRNGGGMYNWRSSPTVTNCILWGDFPDEIYNRDNSNPIVTYSDVQGGYAGMGNISAPPRFADPEYHLQSNSPCIDAGDPSILDACITPGLGTERSDMGAYGGEENCGWPEDPVELIIDPVGPVVVPRGGTLYFSTLIQNNSSDPISGDYWLSVLLPSQNEILVPSNFLNYANPLSGQIAASDSLNLSNELYVPEMVPTGGYLLIGRVGVYPNASIAERWINFLVTE